MAMRHLLWCTVWLVVVLHPAFCAADSGVQWHLLKKDGNMACVRSGDLAAMFWKVPAGHKGANASSQLVPSPLDAYQCPSAPGHCGRWRRVGWAEKTSVDNMAGPVFDLRWGELKQVETRGGDDLKKLSALPKDPWAVHVSVRAAQDVHLLLCDGRGFTANDKAMPAGCYFVVVHGWVDTLNGMHVLRRCPARTLPIRATDASGTPPYPRGECFPFRSNTTTADVWRRDSWNHFTLRWNGSDLSVAVFGQDTPFLKWNDPEPFTLRSLWVRSPKSAKAYWKLHNYTYYEAGVHASLQSDDVRVSDVRDEGLCLHVVYRLPQDGVLSARANGAMLHSPRLEKDNAWHEARFEGNITDIRPETTVRFNVSASPGAAVGLLRLCPPGGSASVLRLSAPTEVISCALVGTASTELKVSDVSGAGCPGCKEACMAANLSTTCENTVFCFSTANRTQSCACAEGYEGANCTRGNIVLKTPPRIASVNETSVTLTLDSLETSDGQSARRVVIQYQEPDADRYLSWLGVVRRERFGVWVSGPIAKSKGAPQNVTVAGLRADTEYRVRALVLDDGGHSHASGAHELTARTTCSDLTFRLAQNGKRHITITSEQQTHGCRIENYRGIRRDVSAKESFPFRLNQKGGAEFNDLKPFTQYEVSVHRGRKQIWNGTITTSEEAPSAVLELNATAVNYTAIRVSWRPPQAANGIVRRYYVSYRGQKRLECGSGSNVTSPNKTETTNSTSLLLGDLMPYSAYNVSVWAETVENGTTEATTALTPAEDIPSTIPQFPSAKGRTVSWQHPADCRGPRDYVVSVVGDAGDACPSLNESYAVRGGSSLEIEKAVAFCDYTVRVRAASQSGRTNDRLAPLTVRLHVPAAGPPPVRELQVYATNGSAFWVRWRGPWPPHGLLDGFSVTARPVYFSFKRFVPKNATCTEWKDYYCAVMVVETNKKEYDIQVRAVNAPDLFGEVTTVPADISPKASSPPVALFAETTGPHAARITWGHPWLPGAPLRSFHVSVALQSTRLVSAHAPSHPITRRTFDVAIAHAQPYQVPVTDLQPSTTYVIRVLAMGQGNGERVLEGEAATFNLSTPDVAPSFEVSGRPALASKTNVTITVLLPPGPRYLTDRSACFVMVTSLSGGEAPGGRGDENEAEIIKKVKADPKNSWLAGAVECGGSGNFTVGAPMFEEARASEGEYGAMRLTNPKLTPGTRYSVRVVAATAGAAAGAAGAVVVAVAGTALEVVTEGARDAFPYLYLLLLLLLPLLLVPVAVCLRYRSKRKVDEDYLIPAIFHVKWRAPCTAERREPEGESVPTERPPCPRPRPDARDARDALYDDCGQPPRATYLEVVDADETSAKVEYVGPLNAACEDERVYENVSGAHALYANAPNAPDARDAPEESLYVNMSQYASRDRLDACTHPPHAPNALDAS